MPQLGDLPVGPVLATVWSRADSVPVRGSGHPAVDRSGRRAVGAAGGGLSAPGRERPAAALAGADPAAGAPARSGPDRRLRRPAWAGARRLAGSGEGGLLRQPV